MCSQNKHYNLALKNKKTETCSLLHGWGTSPVVLTKVVPHKNNSVCDNAGWYYISSRQCLIEVHGISARRTSAESINTLSHP